MSRSTPPEAPAPDANALTLDVSPRKPRLAWQGMERREIAVSVPTQIVEVVRPARAVDRGEQLAGTSAHKATTREEAEVEPAGRLIWTNDNIVALQTLLDEKDPVTREYRYRGKVDLVYIDPPFMVNNDFRADNAIEIELDDEEGVQAKKEPSLVELLAYKDTWRQGLDSFLSMLRERLVLLKELLAPTGSIYVHLDWHAVHYVKVMMDQLFGYENLQSEIIWKRTSARSDTEGIGVGHDTIIAFAVSPRRYWNHVYLPYSSEYIRSHYNHIDKATGRRYRLADLRSPNPRPNLIYDWKGYKPHKNGWSVSKEEMARRDAEGLIYYPPNGERLAFKRFIDDEGMPLMSIWADIPPVNSQAIERLGYPTQKPVELIERIISASCPTGGVVLDCFNGSGTTSEAAERLGRRWIGIDNGKYAIHLTRKRLIQLHGQPKNPEKPQFDYVECGKCGNIERKEKPQKRGKDDVYKVRPFTVENMGVYQRAGEWQDFQRHQSKYRDEMIRVFGGEVMNHSPLLHGKKGGSWIHVGPLDGPIAETQAWQIAREAQRTTMKSVTILSADFDAIAGGKDDIREKTGVSITVRAIPASALDEVRRRLEIARAGDAIETMAIPAFYAPLSIVLRCEAKGRTARVKLERCEIDIESFLASQQPSLKPIEGAKTEVAKKKVKAEHKKWEERRDQLEKWLAKAKTWQAFIDFWAVDWDYGKKVGPDGKPIFVADWQSFRVRRGKGEADPLVFVAEGTYTEGGVYRVGARVTDVFGNDGIATATVEVK